MRRLIGVFYLISLCTTALSVEFSEEQAAVIRSFSPWPTDLEADSSNRFSTLPAAVEFGRQLFFDRRLSGNGVLSCADCHQPSQQFADTLALNRGTHPLSRHTSSLVNVREQWWFGWGGENDNLWAQSIRPILAVDEMNLELAEIKTIFAQDERFTCQFNALSEQTFEASSERDVLVFVGKMLASFQETIVSTVTRFDLFLASWDQTESNQMLTESELRGLDIFSGEGRCFFCHSGANFSNGEFADIGVSFFIDGGVDKGRYGGIESVTANEFNLLGDYNDDLTNVNSLRTQYVQLLPRNFGEFKVPSLRNIGDTAPYMHNGSLATIDDVIAFYSNLDEERLHADGEKILRPLNLTEVERQDLKAFLLSLSAPIRFAQTNDAVFDCEEG